MSPSLAAGKPLMTFRCFDFSGGLDIRTSPTLLAQRGKKNKWLTKASNVEMGDDGSVKKRYGMRLVTAAAGLTLHVTGGIQFVRSGGTFYDVIACVNGNVYKINADTTITSLKSGLTNFTRPASFAVYNDTLFFADGIDAPQQWDGTTWAALGGSSPATARWLVSHGNRLFAEDATVPSRVYWSKLNNATDWAGTDDAGFLDVNPNDGGVMVTMVPSVQELGLLKEGRPYRLQGIGPITGYTVADNLVPATGSVGCNSLRGACFAVNDIWYSSRLGLHRLSATQDFGDLEETFPSRLIEPYFRKENAFAIQNVDFTYALSSGTALTQPQVLYDPGRNRILMSAVRGTGEGGSPAGGSNEVGCDTIFVYDIALKAWSIWTMPSGTDLTAMWPARATLAAGQPEIYIGVQSNFANTGMVYALSPGTTSDLDGAQAAVAISAQLRHVTHLGEAGLEKSPRYLYLYFKKESATTTMTLNLYADFKTTAVFTTTFDITSSTAETQVVKRIDLGGFTCEYLEIDLQQATAAKGFTFLGYEVEWRARRAIRRAE